jgi:hypothetical protein
MARILKARSVTFHKRLLASPRFLVSLQTHIVGVVNFGLTTTEYIRTAYINSNQERKHPVNKLHHSNFLQTPHGKALLNRV